MNRRGASRRELLAVVASFVVIGLGGASASATEENKAVPSPMADTVSALDGRHVYIVPSTADGAAAMKAADADVIAEYPSFSLVSADGSKNRLLVNAGADIRDDMSAVTVADGKLDPSSEPQLAATSGPSLAIVQFVGPIKDKWLETLRKTGATVVSYISENAYIVHASSAQTAAVSALAAEDEVRAVTPFTAAEKTAPGIESSGTVEVAVETIAGAPGAAARKVLAEGDELRAHAAFGGTVTKFAALDAAQVDALSTDPGVVSIEPWVEPQLFDERAALIVAGRVNSAGTSTLTGVPNYLGFLRGNGFSTDFAPGTIDITDEGIDKGVVPVPAGSHDDFFVNGNDLAPSRIKYAQESTVDSNARDCGGHGTNVASIAAGFNDDAGAAVEDAAGFNYGLGIAPRARIGATKIFNCAGSFDVSTTFAALRSAAYASGARISNNSWGSNVGGAYDASAREFDFLVRDAQPGTAGNQQMINIFSAGNAGSGGNTIGSPGTAKNVITVGASESIRPIGATDGCGVTDAGADNARDIINFSSRGPTDDGRLKPDVVAPGTHITGAQPQTGADFNGSGTCNPQFPAGSSLYTLVSGTSQAAPEVSGFAALIRDWFRREVGGGTAVPSPALTKAIMVNTATDEVGGQTGAGGINDNAPTQIQGWGRINLKNTLDSTPREYLDQSSRFGSSGQLRRTTYTTADPAKPLKVTLAYTDAPGPTSGNAFVNNLDLVVNAGGESYKGNVLTDGQSVAGGTADLRNNLENVILPPGFFGDRFSVEVRGTNIAGDGVPGNADTTDQDYALVVSNANASADGPVLVHDLTTTAELGASDGDGAIEPGEQFRLNERLRNRGTATASGITATLSGPARTTVPVSNSAYPNIARDATGSNFTPFRVRLEDNFVCGAPVKLTLDLTTAQGNDRVRISVPTGGPGTPVNRNSTDVPKAIPDANSAGVTSNLVLSGPGIIQDLDVRIPGITHTFVGDLAISLIAPNSTTILLSSRRGASGDNFTNTVFDDEAATAISSGAAPFTGSFRPEQPLSVVDGMQAAGTWTLKVVDAAADDVGTLNGWGLRETRPGC